MSAKERQWAEYRELMRTKATDGALQFDFMLVVLPKPEDIGKAIGKASGTLYVRTAKMDKGRWLLVKEGLSSGVAYHPAVFFRNDECTAILRDVSAASPQLTPAEESKRLKESDHVENETGHLTDELEDLKSNVE